MTGFPGQDHQRVHTCIAVRVAGLGHKDVWARYFGLTGAADEYELDAYFHGLMPFTAAEGDLVAHAVNELIDEIPPLPRAPYSTGITRALP
ncbi:hypothetical protein [Arthrobacter sp. B0490]|uniref:hypothetical protein n=1 Tax=Arthrobacter sp. B0490 TaxID=2058891 RepID=UPI000CE467B8|nr:hypothetical protein [Arthrobacter sp. B0490]